MTTSTFNNSIESYNEKNLQFIANFYNENDDLDINELEALIESKGAVSDCSSEWGICHNDTHKVVINDNGEAEVWER